MKKALIMIATILLTIATSQAFASSDTAVLKLVAVIPPKATFHVAGNGVSVDANNDRFSYTLQENGENRTLVVVAS
jgi:hypothetical protein